MDVLTPRVSGVRLAAAALVTVMALGSLTKPAPLLAQTLAAPQAPGGPELPEWLTGWSPIALTADLARELPGQATTPALLVLPGPRTGAFWTAGNPAALPWEVRDSYARFQLGAREHEGAYRRPLDAGRDLRVGGGALGWTPLGSGAAIGRVAVDYLSQKDPASADVVSPHGSNPFVMLDTLGDAVSGLITRLDGAGGWRLGNLGIGLGLGFDGREVRTVASPVPRQYRATAAGVSGGLQYDIGDGLIKVGVYGRWAQTAQFGALNARNAFSRLYVLRGYSAPTTIDLGVSTFVYARWFDRSATALGTSLSGTVAGVAWTMFAERVEATERQSVELETDPPSDTWDASGWTGGAAAQFTIKEGLLDVTLTGKYASLSGDALRMDLERSHFAAEESAVNVAVDVRVAPYQGWSGALRVSTARERRERQDTLARFTSELNAWSPAVSLEVARALPGGFTLALGAGYAQHAPWGAVPDPAALSHAYRDWIAPELALYGTEATSFTSAVTILYQAGGTVGVWTRGMMASVSGDPGINPLPSGPTGSRTRGILEVGVTMRER